MHILYIIKVFCQHTKATLFSVSKGGAYSSGDEDIDKLSPYIFLPESLLLHFYLLHALRLLPES
jgi:hypothetical protein